MLKFLAILSVVVLVTIVLIEHAPLWTAYAFVFGFALFVMPRIKWVWPEPEKKEEEVWS